MANLIVSAYFNIKYDDSKQNHLSGKHSADYEKLIPFWKESFSINATTADDVILLGEGELCENHTEMFYKIFERLLELNKAKHNVLFTDLDSICVKPFNPFNEKIFKLYRSTNDTRRFAKYFPTYFLSGVRYIPACLPNVYWELGRALWETYEQMCYNLTVANIEKASKNKPKNVREQEKNLIHKIQEFTKVAEYLRWDYEQYVYNRMFFAQNGITEKWSQIEDHKYLTLMGDSPQKREEAYIITFNASHDKPNITAKAMKGLFDAKIRSI